MKRNARCGVPTRPRLLTCPTLMNGMLKASATFQEPDVRVACWNHEMPTLAIEEGGVALELEFPDRECLSRFLRRLSNLRLLAPEDDCAG